MSGSVQRPVKVLQIVTRETTELRVLNLSIGFTIFLLASGAPGACTGAVSRAARPPVGMQEKNEARRITPKEVRVALQKRRAILIDVRSEESYKSGHIKGARSIPAGEILSHVNELPRNKMIVTYCT